MNRRSFHRLVTGALLARSCSTVSAQTFDKRWNLGVITDQVDLDLRYVLRNFFPKYQLGWAEIRYLNLNGKKTYLYAAAKTNELKQIRREMDDAGVRLSVLDTAIFKTTLPGTKPVGEKPAYAEVALGAFHLQLEHLKRAAEVAHALGSQRIRIFTFRRVADPNAIFERVVEQLLRAIEVAKKFDITLLVENEYDCNVGTAEETATLFRTISDRTLMHNWDPCNDYEMNEEPFPKGWERLNHNRISHIHLKDASGKEWKPIGGGEIDFVGLFRALKQASYAGTLSLETRFQNARRDQYASSVESMDGLRRVLQNV